MSVFRLADQIQFMGVQSPSVEVSVFRKMLQEIPVIVADNVCEHLYATTLDKDFYLDLRDLPFCAPPFKTSFVEFKRPSNLTDESHFLFSNVGWLVISEQTSDGWVLNLCLTVKANGTIQSNVAMVVGYLSSDGTVFRVSLRANNIESDDVTRAFIGLSATVFLTFSFMNCKNVVVSDNEPAVRKKSELRAYRGPMVRYKTLEIEPMKKVLRTEGRSEEVGLKRALHICRGHFATYSEDKPLFGRSGAHGNFWIPAHVRGTTERGVVVKDYSVKSPSETA